MAEKLDPVALPLEWSVRMVPEKYILLPWRRIERYGPSQKADGTWTSEAPKGAVVEEGTVAITASELESVDERGSDDYIGGVVPGHVSFQAKLALVQAGLAVEETRGGVHGTPALTELLIGLYASNVSKNLPKPCR